MKRRFEFEVLAECQQFYLEDEANENLPEWTRENVERLLAIDEGIIAVGTIWDGIVSVVLEIVDRKPDEDTGTWNRVSEATINVRSGHLRVGGIGIFEIRIDLEAGLYGARLYYGNLGSVNDDDTTDEHCKVVMWREAPATPLVLNEPNTGQSRVN